MLGIVLLAVIPLVALLFVYTGIQNRLAQDRARAEVQQSLLQDVGAIRDLVAEGRATLVTFGITYAIQGRRWDLAQGNADRLKALHPDYAVIAVADPSGRVIVSSTDQTGSVNVADTDFFRGAVSSERLHVSGYQIDPITRRPAINVSLPVYDSNGKLIAVEYIGFDLSRFAARLTSARSADSAELLVDGNGAVVARKPALPGIEGKPLLKVELIRTMLSKRPGSTITPGVDGVTRYYYYAPVFSERQGDLYLASGFSEAQLLAAQERSFRLTLLGFGIFTVLALVAAGVVGTFSIYRPIHQLEDAAEKLAEGDLSARSQVSARTDEIGALGREFDMMAESIETHVHELEHTRNQLSALNEDLEMRVRRRTAELEASNRELEAFNYSVSHDLRAPLRAIDGFSQALLEDYWDQFDEDGRDHLGRVKAAANRMGELIDSLLKLSRLSRCEMATKPVDLSALAIEIVECLRQGDTERDVEVSIQPEIVAQGDPALLRAVLENLLGNAWKFTGHTEQPCIEFGTKRTDDEFAYFVRDNGAGFDMAHSNKLFGAFQRLHGQSEFPGIGIGLATVSRVIWRHGGRVWAEGEPGKGATFYFTLP